MGQSKASKTRALINTEKILKLYADGFNIVEISEKVGIYRRNVKYILKSNNIDFNRQTKKPEEGKKGWYLCQTEEFAKQFNDIEKFNLLNKIFRRSWNYSIEQYKEFILKFYYDDTFNHFYNLYVQTGDLNFKPNIDHKLAKSRGGGNELDNLQCLSRLENRLKEAMNTEEWELLKQRILSGIYFK